MKNLIPEYYEPAPDPNRSQLSKHVATQFYGAYTFSELHWPGNFERVYGLVHNDMQRLVKSLEDRIYELESELNEEVSSCSDLEQQLWTEESENVRLQQRIRDLEYELEDARDPSPRWTF